MDKIIAAITACALLAAVSCLIGTPDVRGATAVGILCVGLACLGTVWASHLRTTVCAWLDRLFGKFASSIPPVSRVVLFLGCLLLMFAAGRSWPNTWDMFIAVIVPGLAVGVLLYLITAIAKRKGRTKDAYTSVPPSRDMTTHPPTAGTGTPPTDVRKTRAMPY